MRERRHADDARRGPADVDADKADGAPDRGVGAPPGAEDAGAAVDVYSIEPAVPANPLLQLRGEAASRLLLTPHVAGVTRQSAAFLFKASWENVQNVLNGGTLAHRVY
jgi:hypothetical protein